MRISTFIATAALTLTALTPHAQTYGLSELELNQGSTDHRNRIVNDLLLLKRSHFESLILPTDAGAGFSIDAQLGEDTVTIDFKPYSVRSPDHFQVLIDTPAGLVPYNAPPSKTYRGVVEDHPGSVAAGAIGPRGLTALIQLPDGSRYSIEPTPAAAVAETIQSLAATEHVVYNTADVAPTEATCGGAVGGPAPIDIPDHIDLTPEGGSPLTTDTALFTAELACDADVELFEVMGSEDAVIADIENIVNNLNIQYIEQLALAHQITTIIVRTAEPDPYTTSSPGGLLNQFASHWNSAHSDIQRDVAHLFTDRNLSGSTIGIARLGAICSINIAYGLSETTFSSSFSRRVDLTAHELGHNWNAQHCNQDGSNTFYDTCCSGDAPPLDDSFTMCSSLQFQVNNRFCPPAVNIIAAYRNSRPCLDEAVPTTTLPFSDDFTIETIDETLWRTVFGPEISDLASDPPSAPNALRIRGDELIESSLLDTSDFCNVEVSYAWQRSGLLGMSGSPESGEDLVVEYRLATGGWATVAEHPGDGPDDAPFQQESFILDSSAVHDFFQVRFRMDGGSASDSFFIDDVQVNISRRVEIITPPLETGGCLGDSATLSVVADGEPPLSYQWKFFEEELPGETSDSLTIESVTPATAGQYKCIVTNECGSVESEHATLVLDSEITITNPPLGDTLCEGESAALFTFVTGSGPLFYQWMLDGEDVEGATAFYLQFPAASLDHAGTYECRISNPCEIETTTPAILNVLPNAVPEITTPGDTTATEGEPITLCASIVGAETIQWFKDDLPIDGATADCYDVAAAAPADAGSYTIEASNNCSAGGTTLSESFELTVSTGQSCLGDFDSDGDVDLVDFGQFQLCFGTLADPDCLCADLDGDTDVDLVDFGQFQIVFTGES
jgi:hypothetical protein